MHVFMGQASDPSPHRREEFQGFINCVHCIEMLRRIFRPKRDEVTEAWRKYIMRIFITYSLLQV
jgi:hypothetical protein